MSSGTLSKLLRLDPFCYRQFEHGSNYAGTQLYSITQEEFMRRLNEWFLGHDDSQRASLLKPGYAPFCKHLFIPNWIDGLPIGALPLDAATLPLLRSGYQKRRDGELAVLNRWFDRQELQQHQVPIPSAKWLDVILYSREQIYKENEAMGGPPPPDLAFYESDAWDWAVISVKAQLEDYEIPMNPITIMRNALGKEEGGSGVPLEREAYEASVAYWSNHAILQ